MGTLTPSELLRGWEQGTIPPEMAIGHLVQNIVTLHTKLEAHMHALAQLRYEQVMPDSLAVRMRP